MPLKTSALESRWRPLSLGLVLGVFLAPPAQTPEGAAEEEQAGAIHAGCVTEFIRDASVVLGVNGNVVSDEEVGEGHRHQSALNDALAETGGLPRAVHNQGNAPKSPA